MPKYIALLRGINVSGQKMIKMDKLRSIFESMDFQNVVTYIQSGNVIFDSGEEDPGVVRDRIVPVFIRTLKELQEVVQDSPYTEVKVKENEQRYITFLSQTPTDAAIAKFESFQNEVDEFRVRPLTVYLLIRKNYGESKFSNNFLEKKLGVSATTRNWETVNKLIQLADGGS